MTPPPLPGPRVRERNKGFFIRLEGIQSLLVLLITMGKGILMHFQWDWYFDSKLYCKLYLCSMSSSPFPFLWFSLISFRIKGYRLVSLISFSCSEHCLPPTTAAAQVLHECQNPGEGGISYSGSNFTSKRGQSKKSAEEILTDSYLRYSECVVSGSYSKA